MLKKILMKEGDCRGTRVHYVSIRRNSTHLKLLRKTSYQAVELGHRALAAGLADVPDLYATLAAGVDVTRGVADGDGAHHFAVAQRVDLASVARDARADQCVWREGHGLHLTVRTNVKRISSAGGVQGKRNVVRLSSDVLIKRKSKNWQILTVFLQKWT